MKKRLERKSGLEWAREEGIEIIDYDGWRDKSIDDPITQKDYAKRRDQSTIRFSPRSSKKK